MTDIIERQANASASRSEKPAISLELDHVLLFAREYDVSAGFHNEVLGYLLFYTFT
jgi:hypothetical protein